MYAARQQKGFTLIELLVVIGIIGVLLGILLPTLAKSRESANEIACRSNLHQISVATRMYENDFRDRYPDAYTLGGSAFRRGRGQLNPSDPTSVPEIYGPGPLFYSLGYLKNDNVWICPSQNENMKSYRNTYSNAVVIAGTDPIANISWLDTYSTKLRGKTSRANMYWIGDDTQYNPYTTGVRKGQFDPTPNIPTTLINFPHKYRTRSKAGNARRGSINMCFIDGQVGVVTYNLETGVNEVVRSP